MSHIDDTGIVAYIHVIKPDNGPGQQGRRNMAYSTIYDLSGNVLTDGVQSQKVCDATIATARSIAARRGTVVVEDRGTEECYRVTRGGHRQRAPKGWVPCWQQDDA